MIRQYVEKALQSARYDKLEDGTFYGAVPRLRGVLATGDTLEESRDQLAEVVEEWVLVRVAKGLAVPPLGRSRSRSRKPADAALGADHPPRGDPWSASSWL